MANLEKSPIQLVDLDVTLCHIEQVIPYSQVTEDLLYATNEDLSVDRKAIGELVVDNNVQVALEVKVGMTIENPVYKIHAIVIGSFSFNVNEFQQDRVEKWASTNGFLVLLPFMREILFGATKYLPSGPYMVPMILLPTAKPDNN